MSNLEYIDLFAGAGGLSLGLHNAGWKGIFAIEKSSDAFLTLKENLIQKKKHFNWPKWLPESNHEINEIISNNKEELIKLRGKVELIAGGPPCQGFSLAGRRQKSDLRNQLYNSYINFVDLVRPKIVLFENVKGFTYKFNLKDENEVPFSVKVATALKKKYFVGSKVINFSEYGVPQKRQRFILVGFHKDNFEDGVAEKFFDKLEQGRDAFLKKKSLKTSVSVEEAISDLLQGNGMLESPDSKNFFAGVYGKSQTAYQKYTRNGFAKTGTIANSHRFPNHSEQSKEKFLFLMEESIKGNKLNDKLREKLKTKKRNIQVLTANKPSPTLTCLPDDCIHFSEPRILTVREYARLQSFPDWYEFKGKYTTGGEARKFDVPRYTQIGNAIPPLFAELCGVVLKEMIGE